MLMWHATGGFSAFFEVFQRFLLFYGHFQGFKCHNENHAHYSIITDQHSKGLRISWKILF